MCPLRRVLTLRRPSGYRGGVATRIGVGVLLVGAVAVAVAWGVDALFVYGFFAAIAGVIMLGARVGGDWITGASRGRFDRHDRR
jgi:hypothetical protein